MGERLLGKDHRLDAVSSPDLIQILKFQKLQLQQENKQLHVNLGEVYEEVSNLTVENNKLKDQLQLVLYKSKNFTQKSLVNISSPTKIQISQRSLQTDVGTDTASIGDSNLHF